MSGFLLALPMYESTPFGPLIVYVLVFSLSQYGEVGERGFKSEPYLELPTTYHPRTTILGDLSGSYLGYNYSYNWVFTILNLQVDLAP